jgi:hypothetical protein
MLKHLIGLFFRRAESNVAPLVSYNFPNLGPNGEITLCCVIHPSGGPHIPHAETGQDSYSGVSGVPSHCVAAVFIESDQYGLRLRWKPFNLSEQSFPSPFNSHIGGKSPAEPSQAG